MIGGFNVVRGLVDKLDMEFIEAMPGVLAGVIGTLLARLPTFNAVDRAREKILRDAQLLAALPVGPAHTALDEQIQKSVMELLKEREKSSRPNPWRWIAGSLWLSGLLAIGIYLVPETKAGNLLMNFLTGLFIVSVFFTIWLPITLLIRWSRTRRG